MAETKDQKPGAKPGKDETVASSSATADFSWAANTVKLNRAKAGVRVESPSLKGKELEAAVKAKYVEMHGLLTEDNVEREGKASGRVKNMAEHDGTPDDEGK